MIVFITGISGSGKNTALKVLEDNAFFCIDNLPIQLIPKFLEVLSFTNIRNIALTVDVRLKDFFFNNFEQNLNEFFEILERYDAKLIFLDCRDEVLLNRFKANRRVHPLSVNNPLEGIAKEREIIKRLKEKADFYIDTSFLTPYDLGNTILSLLNLVPSMDLTIKLISFGYKYGLVNADIVLDVRLLKNPFYINELSNKTGLDIQVREYLLSDSFTIDFINRTYGYLEFFISNYLGRVKNLLEVAVGCTGGKHRSVFVVEYLSELLSKNNSNIKVITEHRDISKS
ncbi:MAG: RNase adapter RapZ [bacterium]|nr:RNase adapter RapZ [bacterium]